jgi:hypothetical protein
MDSGGMFRGRELCLGSSLLVEIYGRYIYGRDIHGIQGIVHEHIGHQLKIQLSFNTKSI